MHSLYTKANNGNQEVSSAVLAMWCFIYGKVVSSNWFKVKHNHWRLMFFKTSLSAHFNKKKVASYKLYYWLKREGIPLFSIFLSQLNDCRLSVVLSLISYSKIYSRQKYILFTSPYGPLFSVPHWKLHRLHVNGGLIYCAQNYQINFLLKFIYWY